MLLNFSILNLDDTNIKLKNNCIFNKQDKPIIKLLNLPKTDVNIKIDFIDNKIHINLDIDLEYFYKNKIVFDKQLLKVFNNNMNLFIFNKKGYFSKDIVCYKNYYIDFEERRIYKYNDIKKYIINFYFNGFIIKNINNISYFNKILKKKKCIILNNNRKLSKHLQELFNDCIYYQKSKDIILKSIKWDFIINFDSTYNISDLKYSYHILIIDDIENINNIVRKIVGNENISIKNYHNQNNIKKFIIDNKKSKSLKKKKMYLTSYEKELMIGIPNNKINMFYSLPGNYIYNKFITKTEFERDFKLNNECCICLDEINSNNVAITKCNHIFCKSCVVKNLKTSNKCPLCRQKIMKNSLTFVSKFKYRNNKIEFIKNKLKTCNKIGICSSFKSTLENIKNIFKEHCEYINLDELNTNKNYKKLELIIIMDTCNLHFDFIIDIFSNKNPNINLIQLTYTK